MKYISVCSGIEAATVAWHPLGWEPLMFSEIEKFPSAVLAHHYPNIPNRGDMTKFKEWPDESVDILVGGTPCQSFSIAGLRKGLDDPRGNLMLTYLAIAKRYRPRWVVWENVPGVLSSGEGRDFGTFLGALGQLGYGWSYRVLNAQYFGVPQRRRRVFVVGCLGGWQRAAAVLFERESMLRHPAPGGKTKQDITEKLEAGAGSGRGAREPVMMPTVARMRGFGDYEIDEKVSALKQRDYKDATDLVIEPTVIPIHDQATRFNGKRGDKSDGKGNGLGIGKDGDPCPTLTSGDKHAVAFNCRQDPDVSGDVSGPLNSTSPQDQAVQQSMLVRRLTPRECERLQGFPDNYTRIPWGNKAVDSFYSCGCGYQFGESLGAYGCPNCEGEHIASLESCPDGPRYKAIGNSMAVPVMRWIGNRIQMVEDIVNGGV